MPIAFHVVERRAVIAAALALFALAPTVRAQYDRPYLPVGSRVRVVDRVGGAPFLGTVQRLTVDTLGVAVGGGAALVQLPTSRLVSLEISDGRERAGWAMRGAGIGLVAGGLIGAASLRDDPPAPGDLSALAGFFAGGVLGAGFGAVVGAIIAPERWHRVSLSGLLR
jgi:hypothetical protein